MEKVENWIDAHAGEKFGGGTGENCKQCATCLFRNGGTPFSNDYRKGSCEMFVYPETKPVEVIKNTAQCLLYEPDEGKINKD